ncbi:two-component sensor histidine kinase [Rhizocola hellebori]|uniref:Two-component sensor histidine kinase n=1 Tax=Rhizocola hellebori TaxID=1392758 RepID=A0A8J3VCS9_9ACTN|nr:sensor histidine kinase [Rhizocola hellebori]GIH02080.1 two-component sensor histidine kinase [Rhizocola hellebori]
MFWASVDDPRPPSASEIRARRLRGMLFAAPWLSPLIGTFAAIQRGQVPQPWLAALGLVAFIALYLYVVVKAFGRRAADPTAMDQAVLFLTTGLAVALMLRYSTSPGWWGLTLYLTAAGAALYRPPKAFYWIGGVIALQVAIGVMNQHTPQDIAETAFSTLLGGAVVLLMRQMVQLIRVLRDTRDELARTAVERERLRFARDLHDLLGHSLSLIVVKAAVARRMAATDPQRAAQEATEIEQIGRTALTEVRQVVTGYRTLTFGDEVRKAEASLKDAGIDTVVRVTDRELPSNLDDVFGWVVREAVTNVIRHSGASSCVIALSGTKEWVLEIRDDGKGGPPSTGNGLRGLTERMAEVGGTLSVMTDDGYTLRAAAR